MQGSFEKVRDIFLRASELTPGGARESCLSSECAGDKDLRAQVEAMLADEASASQFFAGAGAGDQAADTVLLSPGGVAAPLGEGAGSIIGRYKLLEKIGEGGFGAVYMAEQLEPVNRRVALKIIKLGMDTREVIARFDAERQALALMDHPNVARVLDAGATASGRPFFVMELVRGLPITDYCDKNKVSPEQRLELFIAVCHAVQHAHSKGIIHRDLKPTNILVTTLDDKPLPKIIDFGIAKAIQQPLTEKTLFTRFGQMVGTPVYMSPEHFSGTDVDTRTDVYSLGVILYELLTGKQPFDLQQLREAGQLEMLRVIQEEDPPRPSTRLTRMGDEAVSVAQHRSVNTRRLGEMLRGDLDWITMKALQKNRARRYITPSALAEDLQRHLHNEPVLAGPPRAGYRAWKFVKRHRYAVAAATGVAISLILGLVLALVGFFEARKQRENALAAEQHAEGQRKLAVLEAQRARTGEARARQISYASDMALASQALEASNLGRAVALLRRHLGQRPDNDLRGWEWRYLWQQCQSGELFQFGAVSNSVISGSATADGAWFVTGDLDGTVTVWDVHARKLAFRLVNVSPYVEVSPDGKYFAAGDATIRDLQTGSVIAELPGAIAFKKLSFSRDGQTLAALTSDHVFVYSAHGWKLEGCHAGHLFRSMHVGAVVASTNGWIAVGSEDGKVSILDRRSGKRFREWAAHKDRITALALSPDETLLASGAGYYDQEVKLWNLATGAMTSACKGHRAWICSLSFSSGTNLLVSSSADQNICVWDPASGQLAATLKGHSHEVWTSTLLSDGQTILSGCKDGTIKAWRLPPAAGASSPEVGSSRVRPDPNRLVFSNNENEMLGTFENGLVGRWSLPGARFLGSVDALSSNNVFIASSPPLDLLAAADKSGNIRVWSFSKRSLQTNLVVDPDTNNYTWMGFASTAGRLGVLVNKWSFHQYATRSWQRVQEVQVDLPADLANLALSPDAKLLAMTGRSLIVADAETGRVLTNFRPHKYFTDSVEFSPDGKLLATGSMDGTAKLWRVGTWELLGTLTGHLLGVHSIAFSPDSRRLATGSLGGEAAKVWDLSTFQEVLNLASPWDFTFWIGFSPDERHLLVFGSSKGLRCWSAPTFREIDAKLSGSL